MSSRSVLLIALALGSLVVLPARALADQVKCHTFHRGHGAGVADAYIAGAKPAEGYGTTDHLLVGGMGAYETSTLLWFDLSDVPASSQVVSAAVTLHEMASSLAATLIVHRMTAPWSEADASFATCGGAFDPVVEANFDTGGPAAAGPVSFDLSELVQAWIAGSLPNDGVMISQARGARTMLASSEHEEEDMRPSLEICFFVTPDPEPAGAAFSEEEGEEEAWLDAAFVDVSGGA